jgi:hypothetical protein
VVKGSGGGGGGVGDDDEVGDEMDGGEERGRIARYDQREREWPGSKARQRTA